MRDVISPKVVRPVADWYEDRVESATEETATGDADGPTDLRDTAHADTSADAPSGPAAVPQPAPPDTGTSLASARSAEAFFAGSDSQDTPEPTPAEPDAIQATEAPEAPDSSMLKAGVDTAKRAATAAVDIPVTRMMRIKDVAMKVKDRIKQHNLAVVAAGIAFWALLAIPAVLTAVLSIYGMVADEDKIETQIEDNLGGLPEDARSIITGQLESVAGASGGGLAVGAAIGILLALWTSSGAIAKVIATLNTIWGVDENRKVFKLRGLAVMITFGAIIFVIGAAFLLAVLPPLLSEVGLADAGRWLLNAGRFPALLAFMATGLAFLYWVGPNHSKKYRLVTWGATIATLLWVVVSAVFSIYTARFGSYNETYGSLGAVVVLLMWLFLTAFMVLIGAEIDAAREEPAEPA